VYDVHEQVGEEGEVGRKERGGNDVREDSQAPHPVLVGCPRPPGTCASLLRPR